MKIRIGEKWNRFLLCYFCSALLFLLPGVCLSAGDFDVTIITSRIEGVAPLSVFFDGTQTPGLADGSYVDATFAWNFDVEDTDPEANYRRAGGFVAAHVFEHPGTYRVRVDVYDPQGRHAWEYVTINALSFTGRTYYVADDGLDSNDGLSMDTPIQTVRHALLDLAQPDTRILFRKGDTFNTTYIPASGRPGPVIIAAYEDPDSPSDQAPIIYNTSVDDDWATINIGSDWRIMDLRVRAGGSTAGEEGPRYPGGVGFGGSTSNSLVYRLEQDNLSGQWMDPYGLYNTVAECNIHHVSGTGYCSSGEGGAVIGNWVHDKGEEDPEHIFRLQGGSRYFIAFNTFEANVINYDGLTIRGNSDKVVIYKNTLDRVTGIYPQVRNNYEEYQHHCLVDSNLFIGRDDNTPGYNSSSLRQVAIALHSKDIVIRNNIIYNYEFGVIINDDTVVGHSQRIKIYNNTSINMTAGSYFYFVSADPACFDIDVTNNLIVDNAGSTPLFTRIIRVRSDSNTFNGTSNHNLFFGNTWTQGMQLFNGYTLADWQTATGNDLDSRMQNPTLASLNVDSANIALPLAGSPAINTGEPAGAALDYHGNQRDLAADIGAVEYISSVTDVESPDAPQGLTVTAVSARQVDLAWSAAMDNVGVAGYRIFRNGVQVGTTINTSYQDTTCQPSTAYTYMVRTYDAAGNTSTSSNEATVTTDDQSSGGGGNGGEGGGGCFISATTPVF